MARNNKLPFRQLRISLKLKMTLIVFLILIFTSATIANFIIRNQNRVLERELEETMTVYLQTFKQSVNDLLLRGSTDNVTENLQKLQAFASSYKNITNFKIAQFVDNMGYVIIDTRPNVIGNKIKDTSQVKLNLSYQVKANKLPNEISYDAAMPVYSKEIIKLFRNYSAVVNYHQLYRNQMLFTDRALPIEVQNNFRFIAEFDKAYQQVYINTNSHISYSTKVSNLLQQEKLTVADLQFMNKMNRNFTDLKKGIEIKFSKDTTIKRMVDFMVAMGMDTQKGVEFLKLREKNSLFSHNNLLSVEEIRNIKFINFIFSTIAMYLDHQGHSTPELEKLISKVDQLYGKWAHIRISYYQAHLKALKRHFRQFQGYLTGDRMPDGELLNSSFADLFALFRIGWVRILLDDKQLKIDRKVIANQTIDIAVMIILRMLVVTFLVVSFIIAPINRLGDSTTEIAEAVGQGNLEMLDRMITIRGNDEIGQLADKFNLMTSRLKKAILEIQDKARMEEELRVAQEIQTAILPASLPNLPNFRFSHYYQPQTESGGDYYDFIEIDDTHLGIVVADVTNHGVGAAMVMAVLRSALRNAAMQGMNPAQVLKAINPTLLRDSPSNMFATVFYSVLNTEKKEMLYSTAGHEQGILYNPSDQKIKLLKAGGMPVGVMANNIFDPQIELFKVQLETGTFFIQYSDGIIEAKSESDEEYGAQRFYQAIKNSAQPDLNKMRDGIIADLKKFTQNTPQSDDITLLIMLVL